MTTTVTLQLPDQLYEQAKYLAQQQQQELDELLVEEIAKIISTKTGVSNDAVTAFSDNVAPTVEPDPAVEQERQAYIAMHPFLKANFLGKHVAIYQGQLVDYDDDFGALYARIDAQYPDVFVWLDTVSEEPLETITLRSPIFVEN